MVSWVRRTTGFGVVALALLGPAGCTARRGTPDWSVRTTSASPAQTLEALVATSMDLGYAVKTYDSRAGVMMLLGPWEYEQLAVTVRPRPAGTGVGGAGGTMLRVVPSHGNEQHYAKGPIAQFWEGLGASVALDAPPAKPEEPVPWD